MKLIITLLLLLISIPAYCQLARLQEIQANRVTAKDYKQKANWDSACYAYEKFAEDKKYANPYDRLDLSYCCLKRKDTVRFKKFLSRAIEEGVDTGDIHGFYRKVTDDEKSYLNGFVTGHYGPLHNTFLAHYDTGLISELAIIAEADQRMRRPIEEMIAKDPANWKKEPAADSLLKAGRQLDSLNYIHIMRLCASGKYPGYHNCGAAAKMLTMALLHLDHSYEDWDNLFQILKQAVLAGNIDPDQVSTIVDRHYLRLAENPCYYYGSMNWGDKPFFDCKNVDKWRAEIGRESLKSEYERRNRPLPECYHP